MSNGIKEDIDKTVGLYSNSSWKRWFSKIRFWDAPYLEVEKLVPKRGLIIDLGCGEGVFTNFLATCSSTRKVIGIEIDKKRLSQADHGIKNVKFMFGSATLKPFPSSDCFILFHVLHHLKSYADQEKVLTKVYKSLKKDGKLIVVEVNPNFSIKYLIAWFTDHFLVPVLFENRVYSEIFFRSEKEWTDLFKKIGFKTVIYDQSEGKPFSHITYVCKKIKH
ncbi:class I SAM-dependent methyltransferase [Candidatus Woesebacteria bacterium]|nr:class I SAM-dependent methyltransferase [Candidatus Woesebacteria bacterium]